MAAVPPAETDSVSSPPVAVQVEPVTAGILPPRKRVWDYFKVLPIVYYSNETSLGLGAGTLLQFDLPGAAGGRRPSTIAMGAVYTLNKQIMGQITPDLRFGNDDYVLRADLAGARYPSRFFGIGNDNKRDDYSPFTDRYFRGDIDFKLRPFNEGHGMRSLFVGVNYAGLWSSMRDGNGDKLKEVHDRGEREFVASGLGPTLTWDSRDSLSWPNKGSFAEAKSTFFDPILGSDIRYRRLALDLRHYQRLWLDHVLALRFVSQSVWGEVPFQRLPQLGGPSLFRGWYGGQLRDRLLIAVEAEYRLPITKRWAAVAFGSVGRVASSVKHFDMRDLHVAGGGGIRFSVDKRDRVNIRLDLAYGDEFYPCLQFREAF
ncbi:MAG: BamA/TamA family outer membrane protein [Myxococcales bacterium]